VGVGLNIDVRVKQDWSLALEGRFGFSIAEK
jgi:hypothetical protein